jgi:hypothetical protein
MLALVTIEKDRRGEIERVNSLVVSEGRRETEGGRILVPNVSVALGTVLFETVVSLKRGPFIWPLELLGPSKIA